MRKGWLIAAALAASGAAVRTAAAEAAPDIVVTGRGLPAPAGAAAYASVTLDRERLHNDASGRLEDVLRDVAGFQQFRRTDSRSANPTSQGATLRSIGGNASSRALVLLDGVPQADPFASFIPWTALAPQGLSAARVTRGGGSGPFGAGAVAGTIELFSAGPGDLPLASASVAGGSFGSSEVGGQVAADIGGGFVNAGFNWLRGDGYILVPPDQAGPVDIPAWFDSVVAGVRVAVPVSAETELQASGRYYNDSRLRGLPDTESNSRGGDASLRLIGSGEWGYELLGYVQLRQFASKFASVNAARTVATPTLDQFDTPATGLGAKVEIRPPVGPDHELQIGADVRNATGATNEYFRYVANRYTRLRYAGGSNTSVGAYVEDSWQAGERLTITGGARLDWWQIADGRLRESDLQTATVLLNDAYPNRSGLEPTLRGGFVAQALPSLALRTAAYMGWRQPTLNELYRPFRVGLDATAANAGLDNEDLTGVEGGFDWRPTPTLYLSGTVYWNRLGNAITNVTQGFGPGVFPQVGFVAAGGVYRVRENVDAIVVPGFELTGGATLGEWSGTLSYSLASPRVIASGVAAPLDGLRPANSPVNQLSATLAWARGGWGASATVRYVGQQYDDDLNQRPLPSATTIDLVASAPLGARLSLVGRAENLTDELVVSGISSTGIIDRATPRTFWVGLRWNTGP